MKPGMQVTGNAIDRVFNTPVAPVRKFRGAIDAGLALGLGSVCAFALTLGPAPLNTVALASGPSSSLTGSLDPTPITPLLPAEVDSDDSPEAQGDAERTPTAAAPEESPTEPPAPKEAEEPQRAEAAQEPQKPLTQKKTPAAANPPAQKQQSKKSQSQKTAKQPRSIASVDPTSPALISPGIALTIVEDYRLEAGLDAFVSPQSCSSAEVHSSVTVTPSRVLPPGVAKKSLAPDPAFATVSGAPGALTVTVHTCK